MRAMVKLDHRLRNYIEFRLEHYRQDAEHLAIREDIETDDPMIFRAVRCVDAIGRVLERCDEADRELIRLVYWDKAYTVTGAGLIVHVSKSDAYRRLGRIIGSIAEELGEL